MTKKEAIIKYISAMNAGMLQELLDDDRTYQDATKQTFIEKIEEIFGKYKTAGDSELVVHAGECVAEDCNFRCKGFSFIGNRSGKLLNLVFEEKGEDYTDIYYCSEFKSDLPAAEFPDCMYLHIAADERADFEPDVEYSLVVQRCDLACEEMMREKGGITGKEEYTAWFKKYTPLYERASKLHFDYAKLSPFRLLYNDLDEIIYSLKYESKAIKALSFYDNLPDKNEPGVLQWLVKFETLGKEFPLFLLDNEAEYFKDVATLWHAPEISIALYDFKHFIRFKKIYEGAYYPMFEKYNTVKKEDWPQGKTYPHKYHSLKYHLKKRGII